MAVASTTATRLARTSETGTPMSAPVTPSGLLNRSVALGERGSPSHRVDIRQDARSATPPLGRQGLIVEGYGEALLQGDQEFQLLHRTDGHGQVVLRRRYVAEHLFERAVHG